MATLEEIRADKKMAEARLDEVTKNLNDWEREWGERFTKLRKGDAEIYVGEMEELRRDKERLEESKERWEKQVEEWGKKLRGFGGGEGNEQIA